MFKMTTLNIRRFPIHLMRRHAINGFIGKKGSGKTTCMRDVLYYRRNSYDGVVFSTTEEVNNDWGSIFPYSFIYPDYQPEVVQRIISKKKSDGKRRRMGEYIPRRTTTILCEDCSFDKNVMTDEGMNEIARNVRHLDIDFYFSAQYQMDIPRAPRTQLDYIFLFHDNIIGNRERAWNDWGRIVDYPVFCDILKTSCHDHGCLVIDNTSLSDNPEDVFFWYKPIERGKTSFRLGSRAYWLYHFANARREEDWDEDLKGRSKQKKKCRVKKIR